MEVKKETKTDWRHFWKYHIPPKTHHEQTDGWFWHELDSHDGIFLRVLGMWGCSEFPAGMLAVCPCSTPDVGSPLCRWSPSTAHPPSLWFTSVSQSGPGLWMPQCLQSPWLSRLSAAPQSQWKATFHFFLFNVSEDPPFTFEALSAYPAPTSPKPLSLVRLLLPASLPLLLPSVFSLQSALNTKHIQTGRQLSVRGPVAAPEGVTCISDAAQSQALQLEMQTLTSPFNRSSAKRPPLGVRCPASWISMRQNQRGKKKRGEQRLAKRQKMMVKRKEMWWWEQPLGKEFHTELSVNEGGWGRGRRESNGNTASKSRPRLLTPAERGGMQATPHPA